MTDKFAGLREALENATPGPWGLLAVEDGSISHLVPVTPDRDSLLTVVHEDGIPFGCVYHDHDAAYIAAANPQAIAALLAEIDRLRSALSSIAQWLPPLVESRGETVPMVVAIGSNGERDYFRNIARAALGEKS